MKETIYTIPINEAFDENCACAICSLSKKTQAEIIGSTLGASMMEPDFRIITNEKGFCQKHYVDLLLQAKALPLSLILQTHIDQQNKKIFDKQSIGLKGGLFKASPKKQLAQSVADDIKKLSASCAICDRINQLMERYIDNTIFLWKTEEDFRKKFSSKSGFCLPHFADLLNCAIKNLNDKHFEEFYDQIHEMERTACNDMYQDISSFAKMFDYNTKEAPTERVKTAVKRAIHLYSGSLQD